MSLGFFTLELENLILSGFMTRMVWLPITLQICLWGHLDSLQSAGVWLRLVVDPRGHGLMTVHGPQVMASVPNQYALILSFLLARFDLLSLSKFWTISTQIRARCFLGPILILGLITNIYQVFD